MAFDLLMLPKPLSQVRSVANVDLAMHWASKHINVEHSRARNWRGNKMSSSFRIGHVSHPIRRLDDLAECCVFVKQSLNAIY